jgi:hypothetical protein
MSASGRLPDAAVELMESLYQHRLLDTAQLHAMHTPHASRRWTQRLLAQLHRRGLVAGARGRGAWVWYLTELGADAVEAIPTRAEPRRKLITPAQAAGQLQAHTLAVNTVGIAYLRAARARGDEFGPLSWRHEIAHPIGPPPGQRRGELIIADAVLTYLLASEQSISVRQRFLELDRGTMPVEELVAKLDRYQRLRRHAPDPVPGESPVPGWRSRYRTFPGVQIVLAGRPRHLLDRRLRLLLALCVSDAALRQDRALQVHVAVMEDLVARGPFAAIWLDARDPTRRTDWLGGEEGT